MLPISSHSRWISSPPLRRMAPATPPPKIKSLLAAFTMASVSISVKSPCWITILSEIDFVICLLAFRPMSLFAPPDGETRRFVDHDNFLAHAPPDFPASGNSILGCLNAFHQLQELPARVGIAEVHADAALGAEGNCRHFRDRERRSIARKNGAGPGELVKDGKKLDLHFHLFWNGLDDQIGCAGCILDRIYCRKLRESGVARLCVNRSARHVFFQGLLDPFDAVTKHRMSNVFKDGSVATEGGSVGDSPPHHSRSDDCNGLHFHVMFSRLERLWTSPSVAARGISLRRRSGKGCIPTVHERQRTRDAHRQPSERSIRSQRSEGRPFSV